VAEKRPSGEFYMPNGSNNIMIELIKFTILQEILRLFGNSSERRGAGYI